MTLVNAPELTRAEAERAGTAGPAGQTAPPLPVTPMLPSVRRSREPAPAPAPPPPAPRPTLDEVARRLPAPPPPVTTGQQPVPMAPPDPRCAALAELAARLDALSFAAELSALDVPHVRTSVDEHAVRHALADLKVCRVMLARAGRRLGLPVVPPEFRPGAEGDAEAHPFSGGKLKFDPEDYHGD